MNFLNNFYRLIIISIVLVSCNNQYKEFYDSGNLKTKYYLKNNDTVKIEHFYDEKNLKILKEIKGFEECDSVKYFYKNNNIFKKGIVDKNGLKKGNWFRYTKEGYLSDVREYMIIKEESIINRKFYFTKEGDTAWYRQKFNLYNQKEFINDTLKLVSKNSDMTIFKFQSKDTISLSEPFAAYVSHYTPSLRKYNSESMVLMAKDKLNFNEYFSNENEVKLDTFRCVKYDKINRPNFETTGLELNYVVVFGRWFKTPGEKLLRGYMREYFEREPTEDDDSIKGEYRVYFEKEIYVKDTINVIDYTKPKKEELIAIY